MRFLTGVVCGALLTVGGADGAGAQQTNTARAAANMQRGMSGGIFSVQGKKPTFRVGNARASSNPAVAAQVHIDGGPMPVPTYRLPNGVVLQASDGISPDPGVACVAYCQFEVGTRRLKRAALAR
jgi:hypothetical protein